MVDEERAWREIHESRARLEGLLDREVKLFSFPYGAFNERLVGLCREAGYERVFTTLPYSALSEPDEFVTGRVWAEPTDWPLEFRLKLLGAYAWLPKAFSLKRRLLTSPVIARILGTSTPPRFETIHRRVS
jgi:peptidoglycan/xylan/chitin deacetylase (PgdA/CDA1 family)